MEPDWRRHELNLDDADGGGAQRKRRGERGGARLRVFATLLIRDAPQHSAMALETRINKHKDLAVVSL